ncbi:hypothetical protein JCGZ_07155 [Jatropha curcas]|uniref:Phosphatidylinositol N-acetylglucosaminyltransferase subunit H conserved domain-containing protein n=1 Tax=Jatropha curcas TaxID=180498 RepID=A0A067KP52_JATCU|nr:uncharacterized protein LOC105637628 isoform X2 [Jatropha curcas]XP_012076547.1 uncharacterized protein LOC105637628 isoform X2 [Jatropha curcas]XP_020536672.1 uncharacterized protein LOC105637628 isoform X2 [Jatropha curcas]KDP33584.1 hypothetical protein JCGZ_07155 [Jatropha curcas]
MADLSITDRRYTYIHDCKWPSEAIDVHHIVVRKSKTKSFFVYLSAFVLLPNALCLFLVKDISINILFWSFILSAILVKLIIWKPVVKESVVVMPAFGVQFETHYTSGRIVRHFVPIGKILKPVLLECVTPITCYWSLSLILHGEGELMLVFKELYPPVKMLVPIWKALCSATGNEESSVTSTEDG